jgi:hypothetical protein
MSAGRDKFHDKIPKPIQKTQKGSEYHSDGLHRIGSGAFAEIIRKIIITLSKVLDHTDLNFTSG